MYTMKIGRVVAHTTGVEYKAKKPESHDPHSPISLCEASEKYQTSRQQPEMVHWQLQGKKGPKKTFTGPKVASSNGGRVCCRSAVRNRNEMG